MAPTNEDDDFWKGQENEKDREFRWTIIGAVVTTLIVEFVKHVWQ